MLADLIAEHEVVRVGEVLAPAERVERHDSLVGQRHAAATVRLRGILDALHVVALDVQDAVREVDVPPTEREQFAHAEPGERGRQEQRA